MTMPDTHGRSDGHVRATWCGELSQNKIAAHHRERLAVVYVRQSTPRQVLEHRESTALQYQLQQRAVQLGWLPERVLVVDDDLGQSGTSAVHRVGFQRLLAEIGLNHVGLVLGIEMSRLARSCKDWYHLIELCAVFRSLLADEDGVYDPTNYNDRLLLGLKGTMSEAELHILRGRMEQGRRNKAARGELFGTMPIGYVQAESGEVLLDPDEQAQAVVRAVFAKFEQIGTCRGTLRYLLEHDIHLPYRPHYGPRRGELEWRRASLSTVYFMLKHPQYAGAYAHGRHQTDPRRKRPGHPGSGRVTKEQADWHVLLWDWLPAYIGREQYERNQRRLRQNASTYEALGAPRQGRTPLSGLVRCARCGRRMYVAYGDKPHVPRYMCSYDHLLLLQESRPSFASRVVDALIER